MMQQPTQDDATPAQPAAELDEGALAEARVLVVDDNVQNLELLQAYLEELGVNLDAATDGRAALDSIEASPPDLILLDVMMPRMSGFQVCTRLKASPETRDIPIIMVTALNEFGDVERAIECGADDFLTKPVQKIELVTRVRSQLRVRLLKRQLDKALEQVRAMKGDADGA